MGERYNFDRGVHTEVESKSFMPFDGVIMADEENEIAQEVQKAEAASGKNPFVTVLLLLNAAIMGAVGFFQYQAHVRDANRESIQDVVKAEMKALKESEETIEGMDAKSEADDGELLQLEPFTANLAQGDGPKRFVRLNTVLKFSKDSNQEEFKSRNAQIRDTVISILNSKRPEDILKVEGKAYLKEEIKAAINSFFVDGRVIDVYYTSFQVN